MKKNKRAQATGKIFFNIIASTVLFLLASSAGAAIETSTQNIQAAGLCGCDQHRGIEMYVNNVIHDAQQRGITCESAKIYTLACFSVYCSICNDAAAKERCVKYASDYFLNSTRFCAQHNADLPLNTGTFALLQ